MRILQVSESYWPSADGGAIFQRSLVQGLIRHGHHVAVAAPAKNFRNYSEKDGDYTVYRFRSVPLLFVPRFKVSFFPFFYLRQVIKTERPDVIHSHNLLLSAWSAIFWARYYQIPIIATNHFMPENLLLNMGLLPRWLYRLLHRALWAYVVWLHNRVDFVTEPTPTAIELMKKYGLKVPCKPISNGIDTNRFRPDLDPALPREQFGLGSHAPVLLFLGRLDGEKRIDLILEALPTILKQQPVQLVIVGIGQAKTLLQSQAAKLGISKSVIFTGFLEDSLKPLLYNAATIFIMPSPAELQSIATMEAMASGLPVIATDVAALKELCHDQENGYLFPNSDAQALARQVNRLLASPQQLRKFGQASLAIVRAHHSLDATISAYEAVFQANIAQGGATQPADNLAS